MYTMIPPEARGLGTQEVTGLRAGAGHQPPHRRWNIQKRRDLAWCRTMGFPPGEDSGQWAAGFDTFLSDSAKGTAALHFPLLTLLEVHP